MNIQRILLPFVLFVAATTVSRSVGTTALFEKSSMERMTTDYKGVTSNGKSTLMYGSHGAITFTTDNFASFHRVNIGDDQEIIKLRTFGSDYVGCTRNRLVYSTDNGYKWSTQVVDTVVSAAIFGQSVFILSTNTIKEYHYGNGFQLIKTISTDSLAQPTDIAVDSINFYLVTNKLFISTVTRQDGVLASTQVISEFIDKNTSWISELFYKDGIVYAQVTSPIIGKLNSTTVFKSTNHGVTWITSIPSIANGACSIVVRNQSFVLRSGDFSSKELNNFLCLDFMQVDSSHYSIDSTYFTKINIADSVPTRVVMSEEYHYQILNEVTSIDDSTLVAVGKYNLIVISRNAGQSWQYLSIFKVQYFGKDQMQCIDSSHVYVYDRAVVYQTSNGGITWLPPKYVPCSQLYHARLEAFRNQADGYGILKIAAFDKASNNILTTHDYWNSFSFVDRDSACYITDSSRMTPKYYAVQSAVLTFGSEIVTHVQSARLTVSGTVYTNAIAFLDSNLKTLSYQFFADSVIVIRLSQTSDGHLYALCLWQNGKNLADSIGNSLTYRYRYFMLTSTDGGHTWDTAVARLPLTQRLSDYGVKYNYVNSIGFESVEFGNDVYYNNGINQIYVYNASYGTVDSLHVPTAYMGNLYKNRFFRYDSLLMCIGIDQMLYFTNLANPTTFDSLDLRTKLPGWKPNNVLDPYSGPDMVCKFSIVDKTHSFIHSVETTGNSIYDGYYTNLIRIHYSDVAVGVEDEEFSRRSLECSVPFPLPTAKTVTTVLHWTDDATIQEVKASVISLDGVTLHNPKVDIYGDSAHDAIVKVDTSRLTTGAYFLRLSMRTSVAVVKFLVD